MSDPTDRSPGADHLRARVHGGPELATVVLSGDLDRLTGPILIDLIAAIRKDAVRRIDIDVEQVDFLDLGGLRALLRVHRDCAGAGIPLTLRNPRDYVRWLLEITGAVDILLAGHHPRAAHHEWPTWVDRERSAVPGDKGYGRLWRDRMTEADDRDRLAEERDRLLDERQQRLADHQQWEDIREDLADQRELDLERREHDQ